MYFLFWRLCGSKGADHCHIFWDSQLTRHCWEDIHKHIKIYIVIILFKCETLYLGSLLLDQEKQKQCWLSYWQMVKYLS